jgi:hypothetical protein
LTRSLGRLFECFIGDISCITHIIIWHTTSAVITHIVHLPFLIPFRQGL